MMVSRLIRVAALVLACATRVSGQGPPELKIVFPPEGAFVSDQVTLEAEIVPRERRSEVIDLTFYADGKLVCRSTNVQAPKCPWEAGAVIRPHLIRVVAALANGERLVATARTREIDYVEAVNVQVIQVNASVVDRRGRFVSGLTAQQFQLAEDGVPQKILHFAAEDSPLEVVVAMDVSGSMGAAMDDLKVAARQFLSSLSAKDQVTLVAFNEEMFVLTQRETAPEARLRAVDRLGAWGGTALYDVIIRSIEQLSRKAGRRSLVVFSDGDDKSSQATLDTVQRVVKSSDASLFMVALGRARDQKQLRETLESLAEPSGGRALFAERPSDLAKVFAELVEELKRQYLLGYETTNAKKDGAWRRLSLELPGTNHRVRARQGYLAPTK
ncbi:MAG: VWA domain-containing protein [Vicinamibacterales bacterium]